MQAAKKPHIVHLTSAHPPFDSRIFHKECISLVKAGYRVSLIAPHNRSEFMRDVWIEALPNEARRARRMTLSVGRLLHKALALNGEVYHFHDPELIPVGLLLQARGYKVIYDAHEDAPRTLVEAGKDYLPERTKRPAGWLLERLEHFAVRRFAAVITATPAIAARFQSIQPRTVVINNYPLLAEFAGPGDCNWSDRPLAVAYIGTIVPSRGLQQMVEAMALIPQHLGVRLKLAGEFDAAAIPPAIMQSGGWNRVDCMGFLNRPEVADLLNSVRAGLVLLHPLPRYLVSQPVKLFEYMGAGVPVIASDFPLWRQLVESEQCGVLVDPLDPCAIAEAIANMVCDPAKAEAMGRKGRNAVERQYNWAAEECKLLSLYESLV